MTTVVVNRRTERGDVYVGRRPSGMHYGNPFTHKPGTLGEVRVGSREEAIARYERWLLGLGDLSLDQSRRLWILSQVSSLRGKRLECFCKPLACHGDVLARLADWQTGTPDDGLDALVTKFLTEERCAS